MSRCFRRRLKTFCLTSSLGIASLVSFYPNEARAEFLFNSFLVPSFPTQYSAWDVFYTPYGNINYPDYAAPYGARGTAPAGYAIPPNASPVNPIAYWDTRNATLTQTGTGSAFIVSAGVAGGGNIYSFSAPTNYVLSNNSGVPLGTVAFQFQTDGTLMDFSSIRMQYTNASGSIVNLPPNHILREYRTSGSSFGGITNRTAVQWNLTNLGVTSFQILFNAVSSSNSFQLAALDTAATYGDIIPAARFWNSVGAGNWSNGANWQQGTSSNENGNVRFINTTAAAPVLDADHTVGELRFDTTANVTINPTSGSTLTANTGITTTAGATGLYTINCSYRLGAFNIFDIASGNVQVAGVVSGGYGLEKDSAGSLTLSNNNTFTGAVAVGGGTLTLSGKNVYTGSTQVGAGSLIVAAGGTLGNSPVTVASGATLTNNGVIAGSVDVNGTLNGSGTFNGVVTVEGTALFTGAGAFNGGFSVSKGATIALSSNTLVVKGALTNSGTLRFTKGATLDASGATSIYNDGTLDFLTGNLILPPNITVTNGPNGRVLTSAFLRVRNVITKTNAKVAVLCDGYAGHTYQLQRTSNLLGAPYTDVGRPQVVTTDTAPASPLSFEDSNPGGSQGFYHVLVDR